MKNDPAPKISPFLFMRSNHVRRFWYGACNEKLKVRLKSALDGDVTFNFYLLFLLFHFYFLI